MKKLIFIALISISSGITFSQNLSGKGKKAQEAFAGFSFEKSIQKYEEIGAYTLDEKRNLAISYWKTNNLDNAESLFKEIVLTEGHTAQDIFNYALILRENEKYETSDIWMNKFAAMNVADSRGAAYTKNTGSHKKLLVDEGQFRINNVDINSEQQDFGAVYYQDRIVFASSREGTKSIYRRWNWNGLPFLDTYVAEQSKNNLANPVRFHKKINKKFHEGPVCFNSDGDLLIFTRNNYNEKSSDGITRLKLFQSKLVQGKWSKPEELPFNSPEYSVGHASISQDGHTLFFASDMPGGFGGVDIYSASINEDGTYGEAKNLGANVNTEGNEMFPFIHPNNEMLFFSSNGHVGLGGLDVFVVQMKEGEQFGKVKNLQTPVNSNRDDFSFIINPSGTEGYFASNRDGGHGDDDIYAFELLKPFIFGKTIKGTAFDKNENVLAGVMIYLSDSLGNLVDSSFTNNEGQYDFLVTEEQSWRLVGSKEKYFLGKNEVSTEIEENEVIANLILEKDPGLSLYAIISDKQTGKPIEEAQITLIDNMTGLSESHLTSLNGDIIKPLLDKKINDRGSYNLIIEKEGYLGKTVTYNTAFDKEGRYIVNNELDLTLEPIQIGADLSKIININPIYFDLGKHKIRPDAAIELDKIVKVMNENPNMVVELGSHTDSRGSDKSNEALSDRRAKASAAYIAARITNPERISGKGYGESKPNTIILDDGTEKELTEDYINSFKKTDKEKYEELHQLNRRTEFIIISM